VRDDVQNFRKSSWVIEQLQVMPNLVAVRPWGLEGTYDMETSEGATSFILDHGWDETFGYAFGEIHGVGAEALRRLPNLAIGDFVNFTRCAYDDALDCQGAKWLFVNWENIIAKIDADTNPANGVFIPDRATDRDLDGRAAAA
jgi:hypothetical protein